MYDTIDDAIHANPNNNNETYLVADVHMKHYCVLHDGQNIDDDNISRNAHSFSGVVNGITQLVLKNPSLIERIYFCGSKSWNEKKV